MIVTLTRGFDPETDLTLIDADTSTVMIIYVDYANTSSRRIRDMLVRTARRFGIQGVGLAVRFLPGPDAGGELAARAVIAAAKQDRFAEMHSALFSRPAEYTQAIVEIIAEALELDMARFRADMVSTETDEKLASDRASLSGAQAEAPILFIGARPYTGAWDETSLIEAVQQPLGQRLRLASEDFFHWAASAGLVLILATLAALFVTNIGFHSAYEALRHTYIGLNFGSAEFKLTLEHWVNDGLMALFFLLVGIEIKRELIDGELSDPSRAALPFIGAIGGMAVPAMIYVALNWGTDTIGGWGVPMATDIAFTLGILALLGDRVPTSLKVFVSALAIVDDLGAIIVIALFYGHGFHLGSFILAGVTLAIMFGLNAARVYARTPYILLGVALWYFTYQSGLHATLAGVLTAAAIPSRSSGSVEGAAAQTRMIFETEMRENPDTIGDAAVNRLQAVVERLREPGFHLQHRLENWSNFLILPLFAFFNTGILLIGSSFSPVAPESLGVMLGLYIGKPVGIVLLCYLAVRMRIAKLSAEISWMQMLGAGFLAGVGFTMSIFISSSAFSGAALESVKLAVLLASFAAAVTGSLLLTMAGRSNPENTADHV
ncbi:MAG: Na+/H+ antiporter NhaA [Pseudomonadota bacterium]